MLGSKAFARSAGARRWPGQLVMAGVVVAQRQFFVGHCDGVPGAYRPGCGDDCGGETFWDAVLGAA